MESHGTSIEPSPRGESGEESTTERSLPLGDHLQELPSRFQRGQTLRVERFVRVDIAIQTVACGLRIPPQDHRPRFIQGPGQTTEPSEEPPDELVVDNRLVVVRSRRCRTRRSSTLLFVERITDQTPIMTHALTIRVARLFHVRPCPGDQARGRESLIRQYESRDSP